MTAGTEQHDPSAQLRTTSDLLLLDLQALSDLEEQKRLMPHGDPGLVALAARIAEIAQRVLASTRRQLELTEAVTLAADAGVVKPTATIETMRSAAAILADWRDAERAAGEAPEGSRERADAEALIDRFRTEYRAAFEAASRPLP